MTHSGTWAAVDKIAATLGLSCSGLAKKCGMDPTAFNKSKRFSKYGKPHWPSGNTTFVARRIWAYYALKKSTHYGRFFYLLD